MQITEIKLGENKIKIPDPVKILQKLNKYMTKGQIVILKPNHILVQLPITKTIDNTDIEFFMDFYFKLGNDNRSTIIIPEIYINEQYFKLPYIIIKDIPPNIAMCKILSGKFQILKVKRKERYVLIIMD